jgi:hypothetical protein
MPADIWNMIAQYYAPLNRKCLYCESTYHEDHYSLNVCNSCVELLASGKFKQTPEELTIKENV